jgi:hypothetical protein
MVGSPLGGVCAKATTAVTAALRYVVTVLRPKQFRAICQRTATREHHRRQL